MENTTQLSLPNMEGFVTKAKKGKDLSCTTCGLYKECKSPRIVPYGKFEKEIMIVGEAPGEYEDRTGKPWQGLTGRFLQNKLHQLGVDLFDDCISINTLRCRPMENGKDRPPKNIEINCCRRYVLKFITQYKPKLILLLGNPAVISVIGHRWKRDLGTITKWRGWIIPDQELGCWVCPTFHPSYVNRAISGKKPMPEIDTVWTQDLKQALTQLTVKFPIHTEPTIDVITDLTPLTNPRLGTGSAMVMPHIAFDYETTGLKPHAEGHRILCCAVADSENHVFVFMMPRTKAGRKSFIDLLANPRIGKMAHNMKFEDSWSVVRLNQTVESWAWDSMLAAHVIDNRRGCTSLKFQTCVQFGIVDYSSEIDPYLKPKGDANGNSFNQIDKLLDQPEGESKLLHYCALDAVYEYRLAMKQRLEILPF